MFFDEVYYKKNNVGESIKEIKLHHKNEMLRLNEKANNLHKNGGDFKDIKALYDLVHEHGIVYEKCCVIEEKIKKNSF